MLEGRERLFVAEKTGHADQQVAEEHDDFVPISFQPSDESVQRRQTQHLHPALDAAKERLVLIATEIMANSSVQDSANCQPRRIDFFR